MTKTKEGAIKRAAKIAGISVEEYLTFQKEGLKKCTKCKNWKQTSEFGIDRTRHDGLKTKCFSCCRVSQKKDMKGRKSPFKGKKHSEQAKTAISKSNQGKPGTKGRKLTEEQKHFISIQTRKAALKGVLHPRWKGGITQTNRAARETAEGRDWRKAVFERDAYTCQHCGDSKGGNLNAHHIKSFALYPELRYELSNGITLCKSCHRQVHFKPNSIRNMKKERLSKQTSYCQLSLDLFT
ncbi:HNH endonuclease [Planktothrix agardhii]|jgi:hypothetical protein|uniref:HNH endonuclease n=1 Tax=Planktothrix agardhii TaxID=1160 RepID=UPI000415827A|nr:HNH endonuclease [Planktothrix agardhii]